MAMTIETAKITTRPPFTDLFAIDPDVQEALEAHITLDGKLDAEKPVLLWKDGDGPGTYVMVDGHTRFAAANAKKLARIPFVARKFASENDALMAAYAAQLARRNLTGPQKVSALLNALGRLGAVGEAGQGKRNDLSGMSSKDLAAKLGVSKVSVDRARKLLRSGRIDLIEQVRAGAMGLQAAATVCDEPVGAPDPEPERTRAPRAAKVKTKAVEDNDADHDHDDEDDDLSDEQAEALAKVEEAHEKLHNVTDAIEDNDWTTAAREAAQAHDVVNELGQALVTVAEAVA